MTTAITVYGTALGTYTSPMETTTHQKLSAAALTGFQAGCTPGHSCLGTDGKVIVPNGGLVGNTYFPTGTKFVVSEWDPATNTKRDIEVPTSLGETSVVGRNGLVGGAFVYYATPGQIGGEDYEVALAEHPYGPDYSDWQIGLHGEFPMFAAFHRVAGTRVYDPDRSYTGKQIHDISLRGAATFPLSTNDFGETYGNDLAVADQVFLPASGMLLCTTYFSNPNFPDRKGGTVFTLDMETGEVTSLFAIPFPISVSPGHANPFGTAVDPTGTLGAEAFGIKFDTLGNPFGYMMFLTYDHNARVIRPLSNFLTTGDPNNTGWGHGVFDDEGWAYWNTSHGLFAGNLYCWPKSGGTWEFASTAPYAWSSKVGVPIDSVYSVPLTGGFGTNPFRFDPVNQTILYTGGSTILAPILKGGTAGAPAFTILPLVNPDLGAHISVVGTPNPQGGALDVSARRLYWPIGCLDAANSIPGPYPYAPHTLDAWIIAFELDQIAGVPYRNGSHGGNVSVTQFSPTLPTGWQPGDLAVIAVESGLLSTDGALSITAGWTKFLEDSNGVLGKRYAAFQRILQTGDTNPTITNPGGKSTFEVWSVGLYVGADPAAPIDAASLSMTSVSSATFTAPTVTTTHDGCRVVRVFAPNQTVVTWTLGAAQTSRQNQNGVLGAGASIMFAEDLIYQATAGATGTATAVIDTPTPGVAPYSGQMTIAIAPNPNPTPTAKVDPGVWPYSTGVALADPLTVRLSDEEV